MKSFRISTTEGILWTHSANFRTGPISTLFSQRSTLKIPRSQTITTTWIVESQPDSSEKKVVFLVSRVPEVKPQRPRLICGVFFYVLDFAAVDSITTRF